MNPEFKKTSIDNVELWHELTVESVKERMMKKGEYEPMVFMYYEGRREIVIMPVGMYVGDNASKDRLSTMLRMFTHVSKPDGIIFAMEAWVYQGEVETREDSKELIKKALEYGDIADHPEKMEALTISYEDRRKSVFHYFNVRRDKRKRVIRLDVMGDPRTMKNEGRFSEFIRDKPTFEEN